MKLIDPSEMAGTVSCDDCMVHWALDWGVYEGQFVVRIEAVCQFQPDRGCVSVRAKIIGDPETRARYDARCRTRAGDLAVVQILDTFAGFGSGSPLIFHLSDAAPRSETLYGRHPVARSMAELHTEIRRVGELGNHSIACDWGRIIGHILDDAMKKLAQLRSCAEQS